MYEILHIYTEDGPFLPSEGGVELRGFTYTVQRMGTATITAELPWHRCLDRDWTLKEWVEFRGQRFRLMHRPTSWKGNEDARYIHSLEFQSDRDITLNSVYFYDAVSEDAASKDRFVSNSSKVYFFGTLQEFVGRFNDVLAYRGLTRFHVSMDSEIETEAKMFSAEDITLFAALQQAYELWEVPFYYEGDDIYFGEANDHMVEGVFEYGGDEELLKITKTNKGAKLVTLATGYGSSDNIQSWYPNPTPKGWLGLGGTATGVSILNQNRFASKVNQGDELVYRSRPGKSIEGTQAISKIDGSGTRVHVRMPFTKGGGLQGKLRMEFSLSDVHSTQAEPGARLIEEQRAFVSILSEDSCVLSKDDEGREFTCDLPVSKEEEVKKERHYRLHVHTSSNELIPLVDENNNAAMVENKYLRAIGISLATLNDGDYTTDITLDLDTFGCPDYHSEGSFAGKGNLTANVHYELVLEDESGWYLNGYRVKDLRQLGLSMDGDPQEGDTITQTVVKYIQPQPYLMPSVYRETMGAQRLYPAANSPIVIDGHTFGPYPKPEGGTYYFPTTYDSNAPREHVEKFEDFKPTIQGMTYKGQPVDTIRAVFLEEGYNTVEFNADEKLLFDRFFVKLPPMGFNLFDHAVDEEEMTLKMTSGPCGGCEFKILATEIEPNVFSNLVQVDEDGNLHTDKYGRVITEGVPQDVQNDTTDNSVWIMLSVDQNTFGGGGYGIMPNWDDRNQRGLKPQENNSFALLHIDLPEAYILAAEKRLEEAIIQFMGENNEDKFEFSLNISRIFLAQNAAIRDSIDENSVMTVRYDGITYSPLYVTEYTYRWQDGEALPEINVTLGDIVEYRTSGLEEAIAAQLGTRVVVGAPSAGGNGTDDGKNVKIEGNQTVDGVKTFLQGARFGDFTPGMAGSGAAMSINEAGESEMTVDFLNVRKKAVFTSIEADRIRSVGGRILLSLADAVISSISTVDGGWKCRFATKGSNGENMVNGFEVGDLAICQSFMVSNARFYWRKVTEVGYDYVVLSTREGEFAEGSDLPAIGDTIVQLGNVSDRSRQAAQILSCYGDNTPSFEVYAGIDTFSLTGKDIFGVTYSPVAGGYEPKFFNYGSMLLGSRDKSKDYVSYDNATGQLDIKANVKLNAGSDLSDVQVIKDLQEETGSFDYLKAALANGTEVYGGLILSSLIALRDNGGNVKSGLNGVYDATKPGGGVAGWFGGPMVDHENSSALDFAKAIFRFNGTGYLAGGNITWDVNGNGQVGGSGDEYAIKWDKNGMYLGNGLKISGTDETLASILTLLTKLDSYFARDEKGDIYVKDGKGLYSNSFVSAGGKSGTEPGGTGGVDTFDTTNPKYAYLEAVGSSARLAKHERVENIEARVEDLETRESDKHYTYTQGTPSTDWEISHNLGKLPSVTLVVNGHQCFGDVEFIDTNKVIVHLGMAVSGMAYLN